MSDQQQATSNDQETMQEREYLDLVAETMQTARGILYVERGTLLQRLSQLGSEAAENPEPNGEEQYQKVQESEFILTLAGQYTMALRVVEELGQTALQALASTGIQVPPPSPILAPDGSILTTPKKDRKTRKKG